ncbi:hypothetical protein AVEN_7838-1 [Araneus ventricosus]|uniref:Uncharacterized protein n=1 Tax=Araneus ventricosus TaxID=182803 RepID=A0A4Y2F3X0_ARAVE|nr:hypothetical protein AVEN_7838-1 [Araneus ventricosus]
MNFHDQFTANLSHGDFEACFNLLQSCYELSLSLLRSCRAECAANLQTSIARLLQAKIANGEKHDSYFWKDLVILELYHNSIPPNLELNFERRLDDEDDICTGTPSPSFQTTPARGHLIPSVRFNVQQVCIEGESSVESGFEP